MRFHGAYIKLSPSGKGLRILCLVQDGFSYNTDTYYIKKGSIEVYAAKATKRFVTLTGNIYQPGDVVETPEAVTWLLDTYMKRDKPRMPAAVQERESYLDDDRVLAKALVAKNADKFKKLCNGDISGYPSQSKGEAALCAMLAFYCNGSVVKIDRLFRKSALIREKWDSSRGDNTYGSITIQRAVDGMTKFYSTITVGSAAEDFDNRMPRLQTMRREETSFYPWTDIGAARLLADFYKDTLCFVPEHKMWFCYEKGIWGGDVGRLKAMKRCMELAGLLYMYTLNIKDERKRNDYIEYVRRWQTHGYRVNIFKDAQVHHPIPASGFDADPYIFNCENGTLHLDTGEFTEHRSEDELTKITPVKYNPAAVCERWESFIREITSGDAERARFLQKILGYGLSGDTRHECITILYGATTRNGKGTLCESVLKVYGSYGCAARPETISLKTGNNSSQPTEDIARLAGVRFVNISEPGKELVLNAAQVKSMTAINARFLHENSFDFTPQFKLYTNTNYLLVINDITVFTSGRVLIIPFERHFDEAEQDKSLKREFAKPEAQSAILNWLIHGYEMLRKEGLTIPQSVKSATAQYQHDSDKMRLFMEECMEQSDSAEDRTTDVYQRYNCWCGENDQFAENMKNFKQALTAVTTVQRKRPRTGGERTTMVYRLQADFRVPVTHRGSCGRLNRLLQNLNPYRNKHFSSATTAPCSHEGRRCVCLRKLNAEIHAHIFGQIQTKGQTR